MRSVVPLIPVICIFALGVSRGLTGEPHRDPSVIQVEVDAGQVIGKIRPLHGANGGPISYGGMTDTSEHFRSAGIPILRLHDCQWPEPAVVDIHTIFRDFRDDPTDPENYYFQRTDDYIDSILKTGATICYRLGESIEHSKRKYNVHPPADYMKWAEICLGIIRHYNEGWAGGFHHNIGYWEIWNEPEVRPQMWSGTNEDYYRLYVTTAKAIKMQFPNLKVGGPGAANPGEFHSNRFEPTPFVAGLLAWCKEHSAPMDFFSWHRYTDDPLEYAKLATGVREMLNRYGFATTESHLNEWNYLPRKDWSVFQPGQPADWERWYAEMGTAVSAAFTASALMVFQDVPLNMAFLYSADTQGFGFFTQYGAPRKPFYAVKAFNQLLDTPLRVKASGGEPGAFHALAGVNREGSMVQVLISNYRASAGTTEVRIAALPWKGSSRWEQIEISDPLDWSSPETGELPENNVSIRSSTRPGTTRLYRLSPVGSRSGERILQ